MSKYTAAERIIVKSIVANLSIKRIPDQEIMNEVYHQINKTLSRSGLYRVKQRIKRESYQWYSKMREGEYEYIHEFRERISEIMDLQKRHHAILDSPTEPTAVKQASMVELHKLCITLSNLYDVAPAIINNSIGNTVSVTPEDKTTAAAACWRQSQPPTGQQQQQQQYTV